MMLSRGIHGVKQIPGCREHATPRAKPDVTVVIVMCQCGFIICNKRLALVVGVGNEGGCA